MDYLNNGLKRCFNQKTKQTKNLIRSRYREKDIKSYSGCRNLQAIQGDNPHCKRRSRGGTGSCHNRKRTPYSSYHRSVRDYILQEHKKRQGGDVAEWLRYLTRGRELAGRNPGSGSTLPPPPTPPQPHKHTPHPTPPQPPKHHHPTSSLSLVSRWWAQYLGLRMRQSTEVLCATGVRTLNIPRQTDKMLP